MFQAATCYRKRRWKWTYSVHVNSWWFPVFHWLISAYTGGKISEISQTYQQIVLFHQFSTEKQQQKALRERVCVLCVCVCVCGMCMCMCLCVCVCVCVCVYVCVCIELGIGRTHSAISNLFTAQWSNPGLPMTSLQSEYIIGVRDNFGKFSRPLIALRILLT